MGFKDFGKQVGRVFALSVVCLSLSACSEERCPPPDENSAAVAQKATASCWVRADEFHACTVTALEPFALTENEIKALASCSYQQAVPEATDAEVFSDARNAVATRCVSF